mgnify:FL=1
MANIKKSNNISNDTGSAYSNLATAQKQQNIRTRFDDTTHNDNPYDDAIQYLNKKSEEIIDIVNLLEVNASDGLSVATYAEKLKANPSIGGVQFPGTANIDLPGVNITGNQDTTGNAATATAASKLATARTIGGVSFNGTANINLPGVNTKGNQDTTGTATTALNAKGYKGSNTTYMLMPKDFYMVSTTSNYSGGYITIPSGGECHAQLSLPVGSSIVGKTVGVYSSQIVANAVTAYAVPFDGVGSPTLSLGTGVLGKSLSFSANAKSFNASTHYIWIKINLSDYTSATRVYGGILTFNNS